VSAHLSASRQYTNGMQRSRYMPWIVNSWVNRCGADLNVPSTSSVAESASNRRFASVAKMIKVGCWLRRNLSPFVVSAHLSGSSISSLVAGSAGCVSLLALCIMDLQLSKIGMCISVGSMSALRRLL